MSQSPSNDDNFPRGRAAWERAYHAFLPIFYGILGRLARQGYILRNSQGLEIIHDFFTDVWPQLSQRYDSEQGTMESYAAGAFARFARRRLVRDAHWFRHLEGELDDHASEPTAEPDPIDSKQLRRAVASLPDEDRRLLTARYGHPPCSARELARQHGWSRYKVKDRLSRALVRVSCAFGESGVLSPEELRLADALFCEGHSVRDVARSFKLTEPQVRSTRARILSVVGEAVGGSS